MSIKCDRGRNIAFSHLIYIQVAGVSKNESLPIGQLLNSHSLKWNNEKCSVLCILWVTVFIYTWMNVQKTKLFLSIISILSVSFGLCTGSRNAWGAEWEVGVVPASVDCQWLYTAETQGTVQEQSHPLLWGVQEEDREHCARVQHRRSHTLSSYLLF